MLRDSLTLLLCRAHAWRLLHEAECRVIGTSYANIGAYLLGLWGLPYSVVEAVAFQHHPLRSGQTRFDVLAALVTAQCIVAQEGPTARPAAQFSEVVFGDDYPESLGAPCDWSEARQRAAQAVEGPQ